MIFSCNFPNEYSSANTAALEKAKIRLIKSDNASYRCIKMATQRWNCLVHHHLSSMRTHLALLCREVQTPTQQKTIAASRPAGNKYGWNVSWSLSSGL